MVGYVVVNYLLDTNVWLELLLNQERAAEVRHLLERIERGRIRISEFSLYSLGIILGRQEMASVFREVVEDFWRGNVNVVRLFLIDMIRVANAAERFRLDFDDAYQYVTAREYGLTLVSFDADFDRTDRKRRTPAEVLEAL